MSAPKPSKTDKPAPSDSRSKTYHLLIFGGAVIVLIAGAMWQGGGVEQPAKGSEVSAIEALKQEVSGVQSALSRNELEVIRDAMAEIPKEIAPSVVGIRSRPEAVEPFREITVYGAPSPAKPGAAASERLRGGISGLVIDKDGYIVTSANVLLYRFPVQVTFGSFAGAADLIAADSAHHIALLKLQAAPPGLVPLDLNKAAGLQSGEWLVREGRTAAGEETRSLHLLESIQTTSAGERIGLLNSEGTGYMDGSALINVSSRAVGIYVHPTGSDGFVLPISRALEIAARLKANPTIERRGWVGLELQELTDGLKEYFAAANGVVISSVEPDSPAAKAGLRPMDIIEQIDDMEVTSAAAAMNLFTQSAPGTNLVLGIRRNSRQQKIQLPVLPPQGAEVSIPSNQGLLAIRLQATPAGAVGVEILSIAPQSDANRLGVKSGDIILAVDGRRVVSPQQFWSFQNNAANRKPQLWSVQRGDKQFFVAVKERVSKL